MPSEPTSVLPAASPPPSLVDAAIVADIAAVARIETVQKILEVVCRTTGMGFSAVARVTERKWVACAVRDEIAFGLTPGGELELKSTICDEIRQSGQLVVIDHVAQDALFRDHHTPARYGFQSYLSVPIRLPDGTFFGTLCAIDPRPAKVSTPEVVGMFKLFADLVGLHLDAQQRVSDLTAEGERKRLAADEREQLLAAERAARSELELAGRMKDEFLATLSHELRTPLNAILGWSQIIKSGDYDQTDVSEGIEVIERNARVQSQIIEDLLDMSRIISGKVRLDVQGLDLSAIAAAAVATARPTAEAKGVRLVSVIDPLHDVVVTGDSNRLQQVLWNLLTNAIKFTPKGGRVQLLLERVNSHLEISVIDTGEGIEPQFLPYVFDRFRQQDASTTRRHGGLGLGLAIVKQLVELHGGSVRVKSAGLGHGTTFVVALPLTVVHPEAEPEAERRHPTALRTLADLPDAGVEVAGVRVLVVDDEADARALVKRLLEDCGASVTTTGSADETLRLVEGKQFDVLVSDIGMPEVDGYALIRRVRALGEDRGGSIPAIALTAYARAEDRVKAVAAGFQMHVAKPVERVELITMVAAAAGRTGPK